MKTRTNNKHSIFNYSAGPSLLPDAVLAQIEEELWDWNNTRSSIMEIGHRTQAFIKFIGETEELLRNIMHIPNNYRVLFLSGGARGQFAAVPLNLLDSNKQADYIDSGHWSQLAIAEASRYGTINIAASGAKHDYNKVDDQDQWQLNSQASYLHITYNETIKGVEYPFIPEIGNIPIVADKTSSILSHHIDIEKFGLIYASAQKNLGIAGVTIVIIREDLLNENSSCPSILKYHTQAKAKSFCNTPPTFPIYVTNLVLKWVEQIGGIAKIEKLNQQKANIIYDCIDNSDFYVNKVDKLWRARVNFFFNIHDQSLENIFLQEAEQENLCYLRGHQSSQGIRASMYNAAPVEYATTLAEFMQNFEKRYG